jgi:hypothetical protein
VSERQIDGCADDPGVLHLRCTNVIRSKYHDGVVVEVGSQSLGGQFDPIAFHTRETNLESIAVGGDGFDLHGFAQVLYELTTHLLMTKWVRFVSAILDSPDLDRRLRIFYAAVNENDGTITSLRSSRRRLSNSFSSIVVTANEVNAGEDAACFSLYTKTGIPLLAARLSSEIAQLSAGSPSSNRSPK